MSLSAEEKAKFSAEIQRDLEFYGQRVGTEDDLGLFTKDGLEWYLTINLVGARYAEEDSKTHEERVNLLKEVTGIQVSWDVENEKLIYPPNLAAIAARVG